MPQRFLISLLLLLLITSAAFATAQDPDILILNGKRFDLYSNPLEHLHDEDESKRPKFWVAPNEISSGNWRGYIATWEIIEDRLYLTRIDSWFCEPSIRTKNGCRRVTLRDLFGKDVIKGKVFASWFSDKLRVPDGKQLQYVHSGYASIYERDIIFSVDSGKIVKRETIDNTAHPLPEEQEIYRQELERLRASASSGETVNSESPTSNNEPENIETILITDKGWEEVAVGAKRSVIEAFLGQGEHDGRKYDDVYFVEYPQKGIQISYTNTDDAAYAIFFFNKQTYYANFKLVPVTTDKGVTWGSSPDDVIKAYGKPPRDFRDESGRDAWRRLEYDKIDFLFQGGRMTRISVSPKKCTGCKE